MLTKGDLQAIQAVVETTVDERLEKKLKPLLKDELKPIIRDIRRIKKDNNSLIEYSDEKHIHLRSRMERVEDHLHLPPLKQDKN